LEPIERTGLPNICVRGKGIDRRIRCTIVLGEAWKIQKERLEESFGMEN